MSDKQKWWVELALDLISTIAGFYVVNVAVDIFFPVAKGAELAAYVIPTMIKLGALYGLWKLFRSFNYMKGVPPS